MKEKLLTYIRGYVPLIVIDTNEIYRAIEDVDKIIKDFNKELSDYEIYDDFISTNGIPVYFWNVQRGWCEIYGGSVDKETEFDRAIENIFSEEYSAGIYCLPILEYFEDGFLKPKITGLLLEAWKRLSNESKYICLIGDADRISHEVRILTGYIDYKFPDKKEVTDWVIEACNNLIGKGITVKTARKVAEAVSGMTLSEIDIAFKSMLIKTEGKIVLKYLHKEKAEIVKKNGLLEVIETDENLQNVGGMEELKKWIKTIEFIYNHREEAKKKHIKIPKGTLVTGVSGCGKSLFAKAIATDMKLPLYRLDVGRLFGSLVGETERNTRELWKLLESVAPCVVLLDEIEKMFSGINSSGNTDGGVTARTIASFLYYMEERNIPSFFVATANDITALPPELLRKGRWDEIWFVDLPSEAERREIIRIHCKKRGIKLSENVFTKGAGKELLRVTNNYTGAEIEQAIENALRECFVEGKEITLVDIYHQAYSIVPMIKTHKQQIEAIRKWAEYNCRKANTISNNKHKFGKNTKKIISTSTGTA